MTQITLKLDEVRQKIVAAAKRYGRDPKSINLLAVGKTHSAAALGEAYAAGQRHFGESYVQEAIGKQPALPADVCWHFIGRIQANKTRSIAAHFDWAHCIERASIARRLSSQRVDGRAPLKVCIQVNSGPYPGRAGIALTDVEKLAHEIDSLPSLQLRGLMTMPPPQLDVDDLHEQFRLVHECRDALNDTGLELDTLSMGMTDDLEIAIAEGATIVRVGTAIFGPRETNA